MLLPKIRLGYSFPKTHGQIQAWTNVAFPCRWVVMVKAWEHLMRKNHGNHQSGIFLAGCRNCYYLRYVDIWQHCQQISPNIVCMFTSTAQLSHASQLRLIAMSNKSKLQKANWTEWNWFTQLSLNSLSGHWKLSIFKTSRHFKRTNPKHTHNIWLTCTGTSSKTKTSRWRILLCFLIVSHCLSGNLLALAYGENSPSDLSQQMLVQAGLWPSNRSALLLPFTFSSSSTHIDYSLFSNLDSRSGGC